MSEIGAGSGSSYPTSLDTDSTPEVDSPAAGRTLARAAVVNDIADAIIKVETALGTTPQGSCTDVKTFLQVEHNADGTHAGYINTTSNVTASRSFGTAYQNTSGKPMFVSVTASSSSAAISIQLLSDSANPPTTVISYLANDTAATQKLTAFGVVLNGHYYKVTCSNTKTSWYETT